MNGTGMASVLKHIYGFVISGEVFGPLTKGGTIIVAKRTHYHHMPRNAKKTKLRELY